MKNLCVYCGSSDLIPEVYLTEAYDFGKRIAQTGLKLVYGAGSTGMMGRVADGVLDQGGEVIGVIPEIFNTPALMHSGLTKLEITPDMHSRKARMAEISDGFVALPGGFGTMEEVFEILTWSQIGMHTKPVAMLNVNGFYDKLGEFIHSVLNNGFIYSVHLDLLKISSNPAEIFDYLLSYSPPDGLSRWIDRD